MLCAQNATKAYQRESEAKLAAAGAGADAAPPVAPAAPATPVAADAAAGKPQAQPGVCLIYLKLVLIYVYSFLAS